MTFDFLFVLNSILFGVGLAMDAFSVSLANGLRTPEMPVSRSLAIAGTFSAFQTLMPLLGWFCVHGQSDPEEDTVEDKHKIERHGHPSNKKIRYGETVPDLLQTLHVQLRSCT